MPRPAFRLACCLCGRPIPLASDVYALDAEWQRRFPAMPGVLACGKCAVDTEWSCHTADEEYVAGHLPAAGKPPERDFDSWCHIEAQGTHVFMVRAYPWSALQQGAEDYLRRLARTPTNSRVYAQTLAQLQHVLDQWDAASAAQRAR